MRSALQNPSSAVAHEQSVDGAILIRKTLGNETFLAGRLKSNDTISRMRSQRMLLRILLRLPPWPQVLMCLTAIFGMTAGPSLAQSPASPMPQNPSPMVDTTRPHPRIEKQEVPGQRLPLSIGTLYLSPQFRVRRRIPLIVHFHGAPWLMEYHIIHSLPGVALVTVQLGAGSGIYSRTFSEPARFDSLLSEALDQIKRTSGRDVQWGGALC